MKSITKFPVFALFLPTLLHAGVVYDNGAPNGISGVEMTRYMQADDVTPSTDITFNRLRFWTIEPTGGVSYNGFIDWVINLNSGGDFPLPDRVTATNGASVHTFSQALSGPWTGYDEYVVDLSLVTPVTLNAGVTYWFSLHNGNHNTETILENFYWQTSDNNGTNNSHNFDMQALPAPGPWNMNTLAPPVTEAQLAYQLIYDPVPEPGTWSMLVAGAAALIALRRRQSSN